MQCDWEWKALLLSVEPELSIMTVGVGNRSISIKSSPYHYLTLTHQIRAMTQIRVRNCP
jgi:hypothetical protein